jgi:hypothetical protein
MEIIGRYHDRFQPFLHMQNRSRNNSNPNAILPTSLKYKRFQRSQLHQKHQMQAGDVAEVQHKKEMDVVSIATSPSQAISKHGKLPSHPAPGIVLAWLSASRGHDSLCQQKNTSSPSIKNFIK